VISDARHSSGRFPQVAASRPLVALLMVAAAVGCSPPRTFVNGTVTLDGEPVERASVEFFPRDGKGRTAGGFTDAAGRYRVEVSPFPMRVTVSRWKVVRQDSREVSEENPAGDVMAEMFPPRFSDRGRTELLVTPTAGQTVRADFMLSRNKVRP
jgi:hypothetical protein